MSERVWKDGDLAEARGPGGDSALVFFALLAMVPPLEEPLTLGAVAVEANGCEWVRLYAAPDNDIRCWRNYDGFGIRSWSELEDVVKVYEHKREDETP